MLLSPNFSLAEFQTNDRIPDGCIGIFKYLAMNVLEPVRVSFNVPLKITSGYRSLIANLAAHGQPNSEHMATSSSCAADFYPDSPGLVTARDIFDAMRQSPTLPFHQLIYETGANGSVVHVSVNLANRGIRSVLEGATRNAEPYVAVAHVAFAPANQSTETPRLLSST